MSMISAQCDELRAMAHSVGLAMPQAATLMMRAADTILELRDDLQRMDDAAQNAEHDESMEWDRVRKAEAENAKLRELLLELYDDQCDECDRWKYHDRMQELGVEVDE